MSHHTSSRTRYRFTLLAMSGESEQKKNVLDREMIMLRQKGREVKGDWVGS